MVNLLQFVFQLLSRFWDFIGTCFMTIWRHVQSGTDEKIYDIGVLLEWHEDEIIRLEEISNGNEVLNKKQCKHLLAMLKTIVEYVDEMITLSSEVQEFGVALEELCCITQKLAVIMDECRNQNQYQAIVFQINNKEAFRELVSDLRCCWDVICEIYSSSHQGASLDMFVIDLKSPTLQEIEDDDEVLHERIKDDNNHKWREHLCRRLRDSQLKGGELDRVKVPIVNNSLKPELLEPIGEGGYGVVYKSIWLGIQCATKILPVTLIAVNNEAGILAGLSHPNLIKFIYCGVGGNVDWLHSKALEDLGKYEGENDKNCEMLYLVMEFMDMSLSGMLKKQSKPLSYLLAIDIMHQIASGMCYLHDMHVAHLDLKPDNVLMRPNYIKGEKLDLGRFLFKLVDYGTSKIEVQSKVFENEKCSRVGTSKYMAPEIIQENLQSHASYFQADVWSFAMTCSEILSQTPPFETIPTGTKILEKIKEFERPKLPMNCKELTMLIEECWVEDPLKRPTFFEICAKLIDLKKMFLRGTYSTSLCPKFDKDGALLQKSTRSENAKEVKKHILMVNETTMQVNNMVVGLQSNLTKVKDHLEEEKILGLIGMGGIGKTTLANAIFNELKSTFDTSCFAEDLKNKSDPLDILHGMLKDLGKFGSMPTNSVDAQNMLKEFLVGKKALIVLDDIKDKDQLDALIHEDIVNNKGVTLIITTRHWDKIKHRVMENGKIKVHTLDKNAANKLFIHHSCGLGTPFPIEFRDIGERIVEVCDGLPLSLRVLGTFLHDRKRLRCWERALLRIKRGRGLDGGKEEDFENTKLWSTLKISFDGLEIVEKNMFLDIACFFCKDVRPQGMSKNRALHVWANNNIPAIKSFNVLIERSLVDVDEFGNIQMHDQLRDMGRMIVETDAEYLGTRVWDVHLTQSTSKKPKKIEGILDKTIQSEGNILDHLDLSNLRLWIIHDHVSNASTDIQLFNVHGSQVEETFSQLRNIFIYGNFQQLPEQLWKMIFLRNLDLEGCVSLKTLHGLGDLTSLTHLNLSWCSTIKTLPNRLSNLNSLTELNLTYCSRLRTLPPKGLGNLKALTILDMRGCKSLTRIPQQLKNLTSLTKLDLCECSRLTTLPKGLGSLKALTILNLRKCKSLTTLPQQLRNLTSLKELDLHGCGSLTTLPEGLGNLKALTILGLKDCTSLTTLPQQLGNLMSLTKLDLEGCSNLTTLHEGLANLKALTILDLRYCRRLTTLPQQFGNLTSLTNLDLYGCLNLTLPEGLGNLTSLITLNLESCLNFKTLLEQLGNLTSLRELDLSNCSNLTTLPEGLGNLKALTILNLMHCTSLTTLPQQLGNLTSLPKLDLQGCSNLTTLPDGLGNLKALTRLDLMSCRGLTTLPQQLGNLTSLKELNLYNCSNLTTLHEGLGNLKALTMLDLRDCTSLTTSPQQLQSLNSLRELRLCNCSNWSTLPKGLRNLKSFKIPNCEVCAIRRKLPPQLGNRNNNTPPFWVPYKPRGDEWL